MFVKSFIVKHKNDNLIRYQYGDYFIDNSIFDNCKTDFHIEDKNGNIVIANISENKAKEIIDNRLY